MARLGQKLSFVNGGFLATYLGLAPCD